MSFGAANEMARRFSALGHYDILILDLVDVPRIDGSAGLELEELIQRAVDDGREVMIVGLSFPVARVLTQTGSLELIKDTRRFATRKSALEAALSIVGAK
jgi:SulP family sulfate permease